jgi:hypothetical protein
MTSFPAFLSAGAAGLAALLSGVNLFVSSRREVVKWRREALSEAFVSLLDASFRGKDICKRYCNEYRRSEAAASAHQADLVSETDEVLRMMREDLTRLRLLAPKSVLDSCKELYKRNHDFLDLVKGKPDGIRDLEDMRIRLEIRSARNAAVTSAKALMRLH